MSDRIFAPDLEKLGEIHFGRKDAQPSLDELRAFYQEVQKSLHYPVLWWDDHRRQVLADAFGSVVSSLGLTCYACAILSNHVHLLVRRHRLDAEEMERAFKQAGQRELIAHGHAQDDHPVFSADACHMFKSSVEEIRSCIAYIERNYVKHRIAPVNCPWVSVYDGWPLRDRQQRQTASRSLSLGGKRTPGGTPNLFPDDKVSPPPRRIPRDGATAPAPTPAPTTEMVVADTPGAAITVAFDTPLYREFDYALPQELVGKVQPGQRVEVPFGKSNRPQIGFCVGLPAQWRMPKLKQVLTLVDDQPLIDCALFDLAKWISEYYVSPIGRTLATMVPSAVKRQTGLAHRTMVYLATGVPSPQASTGGGGSPSASPDATPVKQSAKQQAVAKALGDAGAISPETGIEIGELAKLAGCTKSPIQQLIVKGLAISVEQEYLPGQMPPPAILLDPSFALNDLQTAALGRLGPRVDDPAFSVTLLHGVTGSGKTEIYLRLIRRALAAGRQALVLIPEIALTTQAVDRYRKRLGSVAVIHSGLNDTQRRLAWRRIAAGDYQVVLGTLSGVFAPCPRLGLIVVDEEQESSFKHLKSPRFHARDVAIKRAQVLGIPVVLGTATPALETWYNAQHLQRYDYIELPRRVSDVPMPKVRVVDMRDEARERRGVHLLSRLLEQQIQQAVAGGRQAVLLLNRRGYASYLFCASCRFVMNCDRCQCRLTYHKALDVGLCHQCGRKYPVPSTCPSCGHKMIKFGMGTQRIEEELGKLFPTLRYVRVDSDTMRHVRDYEEVLGRFERGELDLMLGTQMIAKGLDFPNVRLVGVVSADTTLAIPDFRASERTFQLVSQVAGRAGRTGEGGEGRVVIQTLHADLPAIDFAVRHDYRGFAECELPSRQALGYPPFGRLALFILRHRDLPKVEAAGRELAERLESVRLGLAGQLPNSGSVDGRIIMSGQARISRIRDQFRVHVLLRAADAAQMQRWLAEARRQGALDLPVSWVVDVDPLELT